MPASSVPNARNLVEGERCKIVTRGQEPIEQRFAESIVIPTSATIYILYILRNTLSGSSGKFLSRHFVSMPDRVVTTHI